MDVSSRSIPILVSDTNDFLLLVTTISSCLIWVMLAIMSYLRICGDDLLIRNLQ
jgi:hypothetical protein